jgi:TPR repeat protein
MSISGRVFNRSFPFTAVVTTDGKGGSIIRNFFDFDHRPDLRATVSNLRQNASDSISRLEDLRRNGDSDAGLVLGTIHEYGLFGRRRNDTLARRCYTDCAALGSPHCQASLAFMLRYGLGGRRDRPYAAALTEAAKNSSIWATLHSSFAHHFGLGVPVSCDVGFRELVPLATLVLSNTSLLRRMANQGVVRIPEIGMPQDGFRILEAVHEQLEVRDDDSPMSHFTRGRFHLQSDPPDLDRARFHFERVANQSVSSAYEPLYIIEHLIARDPHNESVGEEYLARAFQQGTPFAIAKMASRYLEDPAVEVRWLGHNMLWEVADSNVEARFLLGMQLIAGNHPFQRNLTAGFEHLRICKRLTHFEVLCRLAMFGYAGFRERDISCDKAFRKLVLFVELSFLFDDAIRAFRAVLARDLEYALRHYQRLADMGSEAAAWNAERLCRELGIDGKDWFKLQVKMRFEKALGRLAQKQMEQGDVEVAQENLKIAAAKDPAAAFLLAWLLRKQAFNESQKYFRDAIRLRRHARAAVNAANAAIVAETLPLAIADLINKKQKTERVEFVMAALAPWSDHMLVLFGFVLLYFAIGCRLRILILPKE